MGNGLCLFTNALLGWLGGGETNLLYHNVPRAHIRGLAGVQLVEVMVSRVDTNKHNLIALSGHPEGGFEQILLFLFALVVI